MSLSLKLSFTVLSTKPSRNNYFNGAIFLPPELRNLKTVAIRAVKDHGDHDLGDKPRRRKEFLSSINMKPLYWSMGAGAVGISWLVKGGQVSNGLSIGYISPASEAKELSRPALFLWEALKEAITGLSPAGFFTVLALCLAVYYVVTGMFESPPQHQPRPRNLEEMEPLPPPVQLGEVTEEEFKQYDGSDPKKPLLMAIKGQIYDVSQSRMFYGPGGPYALFAGKDASRALAKMSFEDKDLTGDISGLGPFELEALQDWEYKFMSKYVKVGTIKKDVPVTDEAASASEPTEIKDDHAAKPSEDGASADGAVETPSVTEANKE